MLQTRFDWRCQEAEPRNEAGRETVGMVERLLNVAIRELLDRLAELQARDDAADLNHAEWLGLLIDREASSRATRKFQSRMRVAKLRHVGASIEDIDIRTPRKHDRALLQQLATGRWIDEHQNPLITGPCEVGKTWLACALGQKACRDGKSALCHRLPRLFRSLIKADLLILDDWGLDRLIAGQRGDLREIVEDRYGAGSTIITSQLPIDSWHDVIDEPTFADAILDRLIHNAHRLPLNGPSLRKTRNPESDESRP